MGTSSGGYSAEEHRMLLKKYSAVVLTALLVSCGAVWTVQQWQTPVYEAKSKIYVSASKQLEATYYREIMDWRKGDVALTQSQLATTYPVLERVVKALSLENRTDDYEKRFASALKKYWIGMQAARSRKGSMTDKERIRAAVDALRKTIRVTPVSQTDLIELTVKDHDPVVAAAMANIMARSFVIFDLEQQLAETRLKFGWENQSVLQIRDAIVNMSASLTGKILPTVDAIGPASIKVVEQAMPPSHPAGPNPLIIYVIAICAGLGLGVGMAYFFEALDPSFRSAADAVDVFRVPLSAVLTMKKSNPPQNPVKDAGLAEQLYVRMKQKDQRVLLVAGMDDRGSSSNVAARLATAFSTCFNEKVLLIDLGLRNPSLHKYLNAREAPGVAQILDGRADFSETVQTLEPRLEFVPSGDKVAFPLSLMSGPLLAAIAEQQKKGRFVFIHLPSVEQHKDFVLLGRDLPPVLPVIRKNHSNREKVRSAMASFVPEHPIPGVIVTS